MVEQRTKKRQIAHIIMNRSVLYARQCRFQADNISDPRHVVLVMGRRRLIGVEAGVRPDGSNIKAFARRTSPAATKRALCWNCFTE